MTAALFVVVNGPRFSTVPKPHVAMMGADVVNMTQYPEGYLCLERGFRLSTLP